MKKTFDETELVDYIRTLRKEKNITQGEIAKKMCISRSMYARIEGGLSSCLPYLDSLTEIIGNEIMDYFPYDIKFYSNHRLFLYMLLFGTDYKTVGNRLGIKDSQVKKLVVSPKKKYLVQYQEEFEELFPGMKKIDLDTTINLAGKNSIIIKLGRKEYIFLNVVGKKNTDTFMDLLKMK